MDSRQLTAEQARTITRWVDPTVQRLMRLEQWMAARSFPATDPLYLHVIIARKALADLNGVLSGYNDRSYFPRPLDDEQPPTR
jgi:hypothetical protein